MQINREFITTALSHLFYLEGKHLRCSNAHEVKSVFLPLGDKNNNYSLSVVVTVKNEYDEATTTVSTQVCHLAVVVCFIERRWVIEIQIEETGCPCKSL